MSPPATLAEGGRLDKAIGFVALGLSGIAAYAYLVIAGRTLGAAGFAAIGAAWAVVFLATAAFATPLEVGLARAVGAARGRGEVVGPLVRAGLTLAGIAGIIGLGIGLAGGRWLDEGLLGGAGGLALASAVAFAGLAMGAVAKGACAGAGRLAGWGGYLLADGGARLALSVVAAVLVPTPQAFAVALAVGPWVALAAPAVPLARLRRAPGRTGPGHTTARLARGIAPLIAAAGASAALMYLGAVLLPLLVRDPDAQVGTYIAALALARLPLFAFSPLVAIAVPRIAFALAQGRITAARRAAAGLVGLAVLGGSVVIGVTVIAGGGSLASVFGAGFALPERSLWAVSLAAACWLFATAAASVPIAAGRGRLAAAAWCVGLGVAALAAVVAGPDAFVRTDAAVLLGSVVAAMAGAVVAAVALGTSSADGREEGDP